MAASFDRAFIMQGFDKHNLPKWQMVPIDGTRYVVLRAGSGLTVTSTKPETVTVTEVRLADIPAANRAPIHTGDRILKLKGIAKGNARIQAKSGATVVVELDVDVKNKKTVKLAFNFVRDNAGHRTRRSSSVTAQLINGINYIYNGQSNIFFRTQSSRSVTVAQDLGPVVRFSSHLAGVPASEHEWDVVTALGDAGADMNIFFVWEYEQDGTPFVDSTDAGTLTNNCIYEDRAGSQFAETLSHEIGHFLGAPDHYLVARKYELMYGITDARGVDLPKTDVNIMNP